MGDIIPMPGNGDYRTYKNPEDGPQPRPSAAGRPRMPRRNPGAGWTMLKTIFTIAGTAAVTAGVTYFVTDALSKRKEKQKEDEAPAPSVVPMSVPMWGPPMGYMPQLAPAPAPAPPVAAAAPSPVYDRPLTSHELLELARMRQRDRELDQRQQELDTERLFIEGIG